MNTNTLPAIVDRDVYKRQVLRSSVTISDAISGSMLSSKDNADSRSKQIPASEKMCIRDSLYGLYRLFQIAVC